MTKLKDPSLFDMNFQLPSQLVFAMAIRQFKYRIVTFIGTRSLW